MISQVSRIVNPNFWESKNKGGGGVVFGRGISGVLSGDYQSNWLELKYFTAVNFCFISSVTESITKCYDTKQKI